MIPGVIGWLRNCAGLPTSLKRAAFIKDLKMSPETEAAFAAGKILADLRRECADLQRQCFAETDNGFDQAGRKWGSLLEGKVLARRNKPPYPRKFAGLDIIVENPAGSTRSGTNKSGKCNNSAPTTM